MYIRSKERTERMINRYFKKWNRIIPAGSHPFNGVVISTSYPSCFSNFTCGKKYYVINGYILGDNGIAYGVYSSLKNKLNEGMCSDFPAYPIEYFNDLLEGGIFKVIEEY